MVLTWRGRSIDTACVTREATSQINGVRKPIEEPRKLTDFSISCKKASVQCVLAATVFGSGSALYLLNLPLFSWMCAMSELPGDVCSMWYRFGYTSCVGGAVHLASVAGVCAGLSMVLAWACEHCTPQSS
jgi:hypothetical protein